MPPSSQVLTVAASQLAVPLNVETLVDAVVGLNSGDYQSRGSQGITETWSYEREGERTYDTIDMSIPRSGESGFMVSLAQPEAVPVGANARYPIECGPASPQQSPEGSSSAPASMDKTLPSTNLQCISDSEHTHTPSPEAEVDEVAPTVQTTLLDSAAGRQSVPGSPPLLEPKGNEVQTGNKNEEIVDQEEGRHMDLRTPQLVQGSPPRRTRQASSVATSRIPTMVHQGTRAARPMGPNVHKRVLEFQHPQTALGEPGGRSSGTPINGSSTYNQAVHNGKVLSRKFKPAAEKR